ncbi:MAG: phospholipase D-like domain-containing protein [Candidatus Hodarchaeota archaeon]
MNLRIYEGYFSETIRKSLESLIEIQCKIRLVYPYLDTKKPRDRKNLQALRKLANAGAEIKVNDRLHARFLVAYNRVQKHPTIKCWGLLLIGSFDFNTECIGRERYDAGIKTRHPDLVNSQ